jgi:hypothetical protein
VRYVIADAGTSLHNNSRTGGMLDAKLGNGFSKETKMIPAQEFRPGSHHLCRISESGQKACL